jgi:hypothetical protein
VREESGEQKGAEKTIDHRISETRFVIETLTFSFFRPSLVEVPE